LFHAPESFLLVSAYYKSAGQFYSVYDVGVARCASDACCNSVTGDDDVVLVICGGASALGSTLAAGQADANGRVLVNVDEVSSFRYTLKCASTSAAADNYGMYTFDVSLASANPASANSTLPSSAALPSQCDVDVVPLIWSSKKL
jgi:hypothetical protein